MSDGMKYWIGNAKESSRTLEELCCLEPTYREAIKRYGDSHGLRSINDAVIWSALHGELGSRLHELTSWPLVVRVIDDDGATSVWHVNGMLVGRKIRNTVNARVIDEHYPPNPPQYDGEVNEIEVKRIG